MKEDLVIGDQFCEVLARIQNGFPPFVPPYPPQLTYILMMISFLGI